MTPVIFFRCLCAIDTYIVLTWENLSGFLQPSKHRIKGRYSRVRGRYSKAFCKYWMETFKILSQKDSTKLPVMLSWESLCVCLVLDLTVISLISVVPRLSHSDLSSVLVRSELGLLKGSRGFFFFFFLGNLWAVVMQITYTDRDLSAQATTLCLLPETFARYPQL